MADIKISALPMATSVTTSDIAVLNQGGITKTANLGLIRGASSAGVTSFSAGTTGLTPNVATAGLVTLAGTLNVANGGTGVTASSGASSVVLRDANQNIAANYVTEAFVSVVADSLNIITLTAASPASYVVTTGDGVQQFKLPNATTLQNGRVYLFNNNQSSGTIVVTNNSNTPIAGIPSGGFTAITLLSNATAAGTWERHEQAPSNVTWSTNTFDYAGSITSATWNGNTVAINRGGTGAASGDDAINNLGFPAQVRPVSSLVTLTAGTNAAYVFTASTTVPSFVSSSIISEGELINCNSATNTQNIGPWIVTATGYQAKFVASISAGSSSMNVTSVISGTLAVGQTIVIPSVTNSVTIVSLGTGTGGTGTYNLSASPSAAAQTAVTMASGTGIAPVYTRPTWFRGTPVSYTHLRAHETG
jgi:hypothetical protein